MTQEFLNSIKAKPHGPDVAALIAEVERLQSERIEDFLDRQWQWSRRTFGEGYRFSQLLDHIRKELLEIEANPTDRIEWIDVVMLAFDGYNRCAGGDTNTVMADLLEKQRINFQREWKQPERPDAAIEHVK